MFNGRRSDIEIVADILKISMGGVRKTEILYKGNLSYTQLQIYIPLLLEKDILEENLVKDNGSSYKMFKVTEKGMSLLEDINRLLTHFKPSVK